MKNFISFALVAWVSMATVHCASYGGNSGYSGSAATPSSTYNAHSYSMGAGYAQIAKPAAYSSPSASYAAPAQSAPKYTMQTLYAREIYPGQQNYQSYHSAPTYSQVVLPIVPSSPVAKLYVPAQQSYSAPPVNCGGGGGGY